MMFQQILSTNTIGERMEISQENLCVDVIGP